MNGSGNARISAGGRTLAFVLLLLALWNPALPWGGSPVDLILLLDDSDSMHREETNQLWREVVNLGPRLPDGSRFTLVRFGGDRVEEIRQIAVEDELFKKYLDTSAPPRTQGIKRNQTNIEQAVRAVLTQIDPAYSQRVILATDGHQSVGNAGKALEIAGERLLPIFWWQPERFSTEVDSWVQTLQIPSRAGIGQNVPVTALLGSSVNTRAVTQLKMNSATLFHQEINLYRDNQSAFSRQIEFPRAGDYLIEATVKTAGDQRAGNNSRSALIRINGPASILYIDNQGTDSRLADALQMGGWQILNSSPERLAHGMIDAADVLILNDLSSAALPDPTWRRIEQAVRKQGKGLIVLGGPHSFGAGGYRRSIIEALLPVTAEARQPQPPAAVLFLVDESGSMEQRIGMDANSRMSIARRAVLDSTGFLDKQDLSGLVTFDMVPEIRLPIDNYADPKSHFEQDWESHTLGGTRLAPALTKAIEMLTEIDVKQRLIVLVTDGFIEKEQAFSEITKRISSAKIDLIALLIGRQSDAGVLQHLTSLNKGLLLPVDEIARLPQLMRDEVMKRRSALVQGPISIIEKNNLSFLGEGPTHWPVLNAYMTSKERPLSTIHLTSERGDPLLATHFAGAGRVAALPGGLGDWAEKWHQWPDWSRFLGGLVEWIGGNRTNPYFHIQHNEQADAIQLTIDHISSSMEWDNSGEVQVHISDPIGRTSSVQAKPVAPGRFQISIPRGAPGRYDFSVRNGEQAAHYALYQQPISEFSHSAKHSLALEEVLNRGNLKPWNAARILSNLDEEKKTIDLRKPLLILGLIVYLATLVLERDLIVRRFNLIPMFS